MLNFLELSQKLIFQKLLLLYFSVLFQFCVLSLDMQVLQPLKFEFQSH
jgi:hypothetical protein